MDFVHIDKFLPYVLPYAEKCPQVVARRAIRDTLVDLTQRVQLKTIRVLVKSKKGQSTYSLGLPHGLSVGMLESVTVNGMQLKAVNRDMLSQIYPTTDWRSATGNPKYYTHINSSDEVTIVPTPETDGLSIVCEVNVSFTRETNEFPSDFYEKHVEIVSAGALSRLLAIPSQPFTEMSMAAQWSQMYSTGVRELLVTAYRSRTKEAGRVHYRNIL